MFQLMVDYLRRPVAHEAFFKKYASKKFHKGTSPRLQIVLVKNINRNPASILTRQWAKKYHSLYLDDSLLAKDTNNHANRLHSKG